MVEEKLRSAVVRLQRHAAERDNESIMLLLLSIDVVYKQPTVKSMGLFRQRETKSVELVVGSRPSVRVLDPVQWSVRRPKEVIDATYGR